MTQEDHRRGPYDSTPVFNTVDYSPWLMFLDSTVVSMALNFGRPFFFVQVFYATGLSIIAMAAIDAEGICTHVAGQVAEWAAVTDRFDDTSILALSVDAYL